MSQGIVSPVTERILACWQSLETRESCGVRAGHAVPGTAVLGLLSRDRGLIVVHVLSRLRSLGCASWSSGLSQDKGPRTAPNKGQRTQRPCVFRTIPFLGLESSLRPGLSYSAKIAYPPIAELSGLMAHVRIKASTRPSLSWDSDFWPVE